MMVTVGAARSGSTERIASVTVPPAAKLAGSPETRNASTVTGRRTSVTPSVKATATRAGAVRWSAKLPFPAGAGGPAPATITIAGRDSGGGTHVTRLTVPVG